MNYSYGNPYMPTNVAYNQQPSYQPYQMGQMQNGMQSNAQQPQQMTYHPLTFVNGIEGAKAFIVGANQVVYLKDSDSNLLFVKRADMQGKYNIEVFEMKQIGIEEIGKKKEENPIELDDYMKREEMDQYASKQDLEALQSLFETKVDKITDKLEKLIKAQISSQKSKGSE